MDPIHTHTNKNGQWRRDAILERRPRYADPAHTTYTAVIRKAISETLNLPIGMDPVTLRHYNLQVRKNATLSPGQLVFLGLHTVLAFLPRITESTKGTTVTIATKAVKRSRSIVAVHGLLLLLLWWWRRTRWTEIIVVEMISRNRWTGSRRHAKKIGMCGVGLRRRWLLKIHIQQGSRSRRWMMVSPQ